MTMITKYNIFEVKDMFHDVYQREVILYFLQIVVYSIQCKCQVNLQKRALMNKRKCKLALHPPDYASVFLELEEPE